MLMMMSALAFLLVLVTLALLVNGARQHPAIAYRRRRERRASAGTTAWLRSGSVDRRRTGHDPRSVVGDAP